MPAVISGTCIRGAVHKALDCASSLTPDHKFVTDSKSLAAFDSLREKEFFE